MSLGPHLLFSFPAYFVFGPRRQRPWFGRLGLWSQSNFWEVLEKPDKEEGHFVVCKLGAQRLISVSYEWGHATIPTCCPRHIRGPALKGRNMKGFGVRYFCRRWSMKRSGSNWSAKNNPQQSRVRIDFTHFQIIRPWKTNHRVPKDLCVCASDTQQMVPWRMYIIVDSCRSTEARNTLFLLGCKFFFRHV